MEKEEAKACAMEIIRQLGGGHFIAMTGACQFVYDHKLDYANVTFKFKGSRVANYCKITLDGSDTYVVEFLKITATALKTVAEHKGIYNDMLQAYFTEVTGLHTSLGTMGRFSFPRQN